MDLHELNVLKSGESDLNLNENRYPTSNGAHPEINSATNLSPPSPPPRDNQSIIQRQTSGYGNFTQSNYAGNPMYNNYSNPSNYFSGFSSYSQPYGSSMMNSSNYGIGNNSNSFVRAAEENSRSAFQSIESVVGAFTAVAAMFESTYFAVYNSFRAVVGVADQFYRLKTQLSNILSALALFRFLKYLARKLMRLLRLSDLNETDTNEVWNIANKCNDAEKLVMETKKKSTKWPLIMFFGVVFGGPWLIWKILSSIEVTYKDDTLWTTGKIDHFIAVSEYDFDSVNVDELSFRRGQRIIIAPKEYQPKIRGWLLGSIDGKTHGVMPANYLKIMGKKQGENSKINDRKSQSDSALSNEINESKRKVTMDSIFEDKTF